MGRENPARRLDKRLWLSLGLYAALIVLHQFVIQPSLITLTSDAPVINIAGRQRMLSQKLAKEALALMNAEDPASLEECQLKLSDTLTTWRSAHTRLIADESTTFFGRPLNAAIQTGYREIQPYFQAMADAAEILLDNQRDVANRGALEFLLENEPKFLTKMHALVGLYESEARRHVRQLQIMGLAFMTTILGSLFLLQFGILRPQIRIVRREWEQNEAHYQLLVESMTDGLVVFDREGRVKFANQRFRDMLGDDGNQLVGKSGWTLITEIDRRDFEKLLSKTNEVAGPVDLKLRHPSGRDVDTMISPRRMTDVKGNFCGLLMVVTDVTSRKAIEQRSRELQLQLAHADRLKSMGAMAAALAHEINQPLGAISNYTEGCLTRLAGALADPAELVAPLRAILRASHRGGEIIRRTRNFAKLRPFRLAPESINDLIYEVEELCRPEARRRSVTIETHLEDNFPFISVDGIQIQQVLTNLIGNAITSLDRVETARRRIVLTTRRLPEELLEVSVADSGPGIDADRTTSIFEPFVTTEENGTGLGLAIARGIVEAHGGRIWIETNGEPGATFRFTLPLNSPLERCDELLWPIRESEFGTSEDDKTSNIRSSGRLSHTM